MHLRDLVRLTFARIGFGTSCFVSLYELRPERPQEKTRRTMTGQYFSYLSPKLENRPHPVKGNCGVFANQPIQKGELISLWGGKIISAGQVDPEMENFTQQVLQIQDALSADAFHGTGGLFQSFLRSKRRPHGTDRVDCHARYRPG